jgi:hypothetical protein
VSLADMRSTIIKDQDIHDRYSLMARFFAKSLRGFKFEVQRLT